MVVAARACFQRFDARRADVLELFTDDFEFWYPKFGIGVGRAGWDEYLGGFFKYVAEITHHVNEFPWPVEGDAVMVEGTTSGRLHDGATWHSGSTIGSYFCTTFDFRGGRIARMYTYLNPDLGAAARPCPPLATDRQSEVGAMSREEMMAVVLAYYERGEARRADVVELFTDDFQFLSPRAGIGVGLADYREVHSVASYKDVPNIAHDIGGFRWIIDGNTAAVEGILHGAFSDGTTWHGGRTPAGRCCFVFTLREGRITRRYAYMDPDYRSTDRDRFLWPGRQPESPGVRW